MGIVEIVETIDALIWAGQMFTTPGETEKERRALRGYCSQRNVENCEICSLVSYGMDCHNNVVETGLTRSTSRNCYKE